MNLFSFWLKSVVFLSFFLFFPPPPHLANMEMYNDPPAAIFQAKVTKNLADQGDSSGDLGALRIKDVLLEFWTTLKASDKFKSVTAALVPLHLRQGPQRNSINCH